MSTQAPRFATPFRSYVCEGDTIDATIGQSSLRIVATIERDNDAGRPDENCDGFWPSRDSDDAGYFPHDTEAEFDAEHARCAKVMSAWEADEWFYCGVVLSVWLGDICLDEHAASLWCVGANCPGVTRGANAYLTEVANELLGEAIDAAIESLKAYVDAAGEAKAALAELVA